MPRRSLAVPVVCLALSLPLAGCGSGGAPMRVLVGAYFPAWMLCALIGCGAAIAARAVMVALRLHEVLPHQLSLSLALGALVAAVVWLVWFGG